MKNKNVQPFIKETTKNVIYKASFITGQSVRQICNDFCNHSLLNKMKLAEELTPYLKWDFKIENKTYAAQDNPLKSYPFTGNLERVNVNVEFKLYEFANSLAHSIGWSVAKIIAYCIERSMNDFDFINQYMMDYLESNLEESEKNIIKEILGDINETQNEDHSILAFLIGVVDEVKTADQNFSESLYQLTERWQ